MMAAGAVTGPLGDATGALGDATVGSLDTLFPSIGVALFVDAVSVAGTGGEGVADAGTSGAGTDLAFK